MHLLDHRVERSRSARSSRSLATNSTSISRPYRSPSKSNTCASSSGTVPPTVGRVPRLATPGAVGAPANPMHAHREDAVQRRALAAEPQVRRRETERRARAAGRAPRARPSSTAARASARPAPGRPRAERAADLAAAHAHAVQRAPAAPRPPEAEAAARLRQQRRRWPSPLRPNLKSWPMTTTGALRSSHKQAHELLPGEAPQLLTEPQLQHEAEPRALQSAPAFAPRREPRRRIGRGQVLPWHGLERQHHGRPRQALPMRQQGADERLVTRMDAVERADGDDGALMALAQIRQSANELQNVAPSKRLSIGARTPRSRGPAGRISRRRRASRSRCR